ncbi:MAG: ASKHA domain-containing protein [Candidatus Omnitrophota bacterium]|jgi:uncharacterized 2Fe-2S/4Fe-4S cluster protein (DUF4445 family)
MNKFKVVFYPDNKSVEVPDDTTILFAALSAGVSLNSTCGGDGVCGRCKVVLKKGRVVTQPTGRISVEEKNRGVYLACLTSIHSDVEIEVPPESRLDLENLSQQDAELRLKGMFARAEEVEAAMPDLVDGIFVHAPLVRKISVTLPRPTHQDRISDLERLYRAVGSGKEPAPVLTGLSNIRRLGELLRAADWNVTVTVNLKEGVREIVSIEPGDTEKKNFGFAFDIGTTTISGQLVDLNNKKVLGTKAAYNKQASFGSDVITRIIYAQKTDGLEKLHHAVIDTMNEIIHDLAAEHQVDLNDASGVTCAGNTTMIHLLLRIDPAYIRREPYVPTANAVPVIRAAESGIKISPRGLLYCVPGVASYIGGDVTAGVLSCGLDRENEVCMLIDIGTNGEIVVGNRDFLIAASASAGPAFEGSGVSCGMRSSKGAIQKVRLERTSPPVYETIGGGKPRGICGSGYIDGIAAMLRAGLLDKDGKIKDGTNERVREGQFGREFVLACKNEADADSDIFITEADIENIKRAKAAIYAAAHILLRHCDMDFKDVKKIFIAGGFGTCIDMENAVTLGLLPDIERKKFLFVGNSSLAGSRSTLLSEEAFHKSYEIAGKITYFELSVEPEYMDEYMAALFFPHTDLNRFPTVL